jgi:hypothetical protein
LFTVFIYDLIPSVAGYRISPDAPLLNLQKILIVLLLLGLLLFRSQLYKQRFDKSISVVLTILIVVRFLSVFNAVDFSTSFSFWLSSSFYWYFFYYATFKLVNKEDEIVRVVKAIVLSGFITAIFNLIEFGTGFYAPHLFPGVAESLSYWQYQRSGITRAFGLLADPVATSYYLVPIIPLGMFLYYKTRKRIWAGFSIMTVTGLFFNLTRASIVALASMWIVYSFFLTRNRWLKTSLVTLICLVLFVLDNPVSRLFYETVNPRTESGVELQDIFQRRFSGIYDVGPRILLNLPLFGVGAGSMVRETLMDEYFQRAGYLYSETSIRTEFPFVYTVSMESGILAGLLYVLLFYFALLKSYKMFRGATSRQNELTASLFLSFTGYLICLGFNGVFASLNLFFVLLGLLNARINQGKELTTQDKPDGAWYGIPPRRSQLALSLFRR